MRWVLRATGVLACAFYMATGEGDVAARAPGDELPDGPGRKVLQAACTACHDLGEVTKFKGYYTKAQWKDVVVTMVEYGAPVAEADVDVLADYLAVNLGKQD